MDQMTYPQLIEHLKDSTSYIADIENHEMLHMSQSAMELFGLDSEQAYRGQKCYQVLHGVDRPCTFCTNSKIKQERSASWLQYNAPLKKWILLNDQFKEIDGRKCRVEIVRELNQRHLWEDNLTEQLTAESILLQCIQTLSVNPDMDDAISSFLEMVSRFYCADRGYIFEFDPENHVLNNTFEWCAEGVTQEIHHLQNIPLDVVDNWIAKFKADGEFFISSINSDLDVNSIDYQMLVAQQVDSLMAAPLYADGEIVGFIGVDNPEANLQNTTLLRATTDFVAVELDKRRMLKHLEHLSYTDTLTGVFNRNKYRLDLSKRYKNVPEKLGIFLVDINGLNGINNSFGHLYGDSIIIKTAQLLKQTVPYDIYRIGGDEFIIPCPDIELDQFHQVLADLKTAFRASPDCKISIGSSWTQRNVNIDTQILQADEQMRVEKQSYYHNAYLEGHQIGANPAADVLEEIANGRFIVYYQPKVDLASHRIVGAEALVRKLDRDGSIIPPAQFISQYEARNVLMHVDIYVLDTALATVRQLQDAGQDLYIAINFSRSTLMMPNFVDNVLMMCAKHAVSPRSIVLEVTETISTIDRERLRTLLQDMRNAGLRLSLDDFGSKYSNTAILADIEFDEVKLDKSLVDDICHNPRSLTILKNLMGMCQELENTTVVAEGIETADQAALLRQYSCNCGQGFHFYRPMPLEHLTHLLEQQT